MFAYECEYEWCDIRYDKKGVGDVIKWIVLVFIIILFAVLILFAVGNGQNKQNPDKQEPRRQQRKRQEEEENQRIRAAETEKTRKAESRKKEEKDQCSNAAEVEKIQESEKRRKEALALQYYNLTVEAERLKADLRYLDTFTRYFRVYQVILGAARRMQKEAMSKGRYLDEVETEIDNYKLDRILTKQGFQIPPAHMERFDQAVIRQRCLNLPFEVLEQEVGKQQDLCRARGSAERFRAWIEQTEQPLYELMQAVRQEDVPRCLSCSKKIHDALEQNNCYAMYADDAKVMADEGMRICFEDDVPEATEQPAFFSKIANGGYSLVAQCGGTRRVMK